MKLSEALTETAEWWAIEGVDRGMPIEEQDKLWHSEANQILRDNYNSGNSWVLRFNDNTARCYLCLLESEYQKDIELEKDTSILNTWNEAQTQLKNLTK